MTVRTLPENANLDQLRAQAKELRRAAADGNPTALARVREVLPAAGAELSLRDAQLVIAREHGQPGWRELAAAVVAQQSAGRDLNRWFGVELNNSTWDAIETGLSAASSEEERLQYLYAAYASTYHWRQVGTVANHGRGEYLIASVAMAIGRPDLAREHAERYARLIERHPAAFTDWDRAFATEGLARLASLTGDPRAAELKRQAYEQAEALDEPDRRINLERLATPPW